jgi:hypothetical protein
MSALQLTANQAQIINDIDTTMQQAFLSGVEDNLFNIIVPPITDYNLLTTSQQGMVKYIFKAAVAAFVVTANWDQELPSVKFSGTATLAKLTGGGSTGSIVFVDGIAVSAVNPT